MHQHNSLVCQDLLANISEYIDGSLREDLCVMLEEHIHSCENCAIVVDTMKKTIELYHEMSEEEQDLPEDVRRRLFVRLALDDFIDPSMNQA